IKSFDELISFCKEAVKLICECVEKRKGLSNNDIMDSAKRFIDDNFDKNLSLEQVAKYAHLNATYFSELFKKETGMSFVDYKTHLRIENAKNLLTTTNDNIEKISSSLGYSDSKYFSKLFKKITGFTPHDFKKGK
ncbi:MAG: AraC family transcriptional regulator, partial [Bacillota bacterium]|nr:AraC family transcriptional regulator [Bacillota bacterium]